MLPVILFCGALVSATEKADKVDVVDDDLQIPPISAPIQAPLIIWEPIMKPNIMPFVVPNEKPTEKPRPCCCKTINLNSDIDFENPECCPAEPLTPDQCNDIVWKSGYCVYDPLAAKDCWTPKPTPEPTQEECCCKTVNVKPDDTSVNKKCCPELYGSGLPWSPQECNELQWSTGRCVYDLEQCPTEKPTPEPVKECCCKTANVDPNDPWVNPECCPELHGNGLPWSPQRCNGLQWNTGKCWYDVRECPTKEPTPEPTEKPTKPAPTEKPTEEPTVEECCCKTINDDLTNTWVNRECCPETYGDGPAWTPQQCNQLIWSTGSCQYDFDMCPAETTEAPTNEETPAPTEFCSARCYGLNSKDDALNQQMFLGQCSNRNGPWSGWYNRDTTDMTGDWELLEIEPNQPCNGETPVDAECETVNGVQWDQTGMVFHIPCGPTGIVCRHADNPGNCPDFRVRYQCPGPCECEMPLTTPKKVDTTECDCCSDYETKGDCKKHKCSSTKKKGGKHVMKKKKCKWKKNEEKCTCKFKNPLESHCQ